MYRIYVAGPIDDNNLDKALEWRVEVHDWNPMPDEVEVFDPLRNKDTETIIARSFGANEIVIRDLEDIDKCDIVLANVPKSDSPKPLFGTPCEIMYAWLHRKPVVLVTDDPRLSNHYWVNCLCVKILPTVTSALNYIEDYWMKS